MWELRKEGDRIALYFMGEYQFRATPEEIELLKQCLEAGVKE